MESNRISEDPRNNKEIPENSSSYINFNRNNSKCIYFKLFEVIHYNSWGGYSEGFLAQIHIHHPALFAEGRTGVSSSKERKVEAEIKGNIKFKPF